MTPPFPKRRFAVIYADPPWPFATWSPRGDGRAPDYGTMGIEDIASLSISEIAADDCALFLWIVDYQLLAGLHLIERWGFTYRSLAFDWVKVTANGKYPIGMGYATRKGSEQCYLATRGSPKRLDKGVRQVVLAERREHSRKPDIIRTSIERLYAGPYLELFARELSIPGWKAWGNETDKFKAA